MRFLLDPVPWILPDTDLRQPTLRVVIETIKVHDVRRIIFETTEHEVSRHRFEQRDRKF
jgi:hypothetical protein